MEYKYKHSASSIGANKKHIQLTPKYRYHMMRQEKLKTFHLGNVDANTRSFFIPTPSHSPHTLSSSNYTKHLQLTYGLS